MERTLASKIHPSIRPFIFGLSPSPGGTGSPSGCTYGGRRQFVPTKSLPGRLANPDGTLTLDGPFRGSLNLDGWQVQIEPKHGPVFTVGTAGGWFSLGSKGAGDGTLNLPIYAIAISGKDVYVGGSFTDVNDNGTVLPEADYIARWDGDSWSALGSNGEGDGALDQVVYAIAVNGTDVYVGGEFTDVNNNGTLLPTADFIARYWPGISLIHLPIIIRSEAD